MPAKRKAAKRKTNKAADTTSALQASEDLDSIMTPEGQ